MDKKTGEERWRLLQATDKMKDQTYFLCKLTQRQLACLEFPLGDFKSKDLVKEVAMGQKGNPVIAHIAATKRESVGVCFIGKRQNFKEFLKQYLPPPKEGPMLLLDSWERRKKRGRKGERYQSERQNEKRGKTETHRKVRSSEGDKKHTQESSLQKMITEERVGTHEGLCFYTIGQRVKLSGAASKYYVAKKDTETNSILLVTSNSHPALSATLIHAAQFSWISGKPPTALLTRKGLRLTARIRHRGDLLACVARIVPTNTLGSESEPLFKALSLATWKKASPKQQLKDWSTVVEVRLVDAVVAAAPGQYLVLYCGDECLGGGHIASVRS